METQRTIKVQLLLTEDEMRVLDDWRFDCRMPTRAAAVRELLRRGLLTKEGEAPEGDLADAGNKNKDTRDESS